MAMSVEITPKRDENIGGLELSVGWRGRAETRSASAAPADSSRTDIAEWLKKLAELMLVCPANVLISRSIRVASEAGGRAR
jgi:hypothetical protein